MKNRLARCTIFLIIGAGIGLGINHYKKQKELDSGVIPLSADDQATATILKAPVTIEEEEATDENNNPAGLGGAFSLTDQNGKAVTEKDYSSSYKLVFFGFTFCPAVCPTELQKVTLVMNELGKASSKIQPIFITVDPERDTPEQIKGYIKQFHPKLVGLTGNAEQIKSVTDAYRVYATKVENEHMEGYMMDHSAYLYLMSPDDKLIAVYPSKDKVTDIVEDIKKRNL